MLDTSGSMGFVTNPDEVEHTGQYGFEDGHQVEYVHNGTPRISVLNDAVRKMLHTFARYERDATEFLIAIITFGEDTRLALPPSPASEVRFTDLVPCGETPLGRALEIAKELIEDKTQIPSRAYRPVVILVSDGEPTDSYQTQLDDFIRNGRTAKCDRMALAITQEADRAMLAKFVEGTNHQVFEADTSDRITDFFHFVTMSSVQRSMSRNPNIVPEDSHVQTPPPPPAMAPGAFAPSVKPESKQQDDDDEGYW